MNHVDVQDGPRPGAIVTVDELNARFYGRFPFPWRPAKFDSLLDSDFQTVMLNQNLGDWQHRLIPERPRIWVAGCGTNQALINALMFPRATVVGSDLSKESLELCSRTAKELGVRNLELRRESINEAGYTEQFDYVICTGVIHHNADPGATLDRLSAALRPGGVMELMVYNRYERLPTTAFQKAVRMLAGGGGTDDFDGDILRARKIISDLRLTNFEELDRNNVDEYPECLIADLLIQPVENSYTVESFIELGAASGLEMLYPCCDLFDNPRADAPWDLTFTDPDLRREYDALPDLPRWQVTNHLMFERSPQLWFYFQRRDAGRPRKSEQEVCAEFLEQRFVRAGAVQQSYIRVGESYRPSPKQVAYPATAPKGAALAVYEAADGRRTMREILTALEQPLTFGHLNSLRLALTTTAHPYLRAVSGRADEARPGAAERQSRGTANLEKFRSIKPRPVTLPDLNG
ncbi:MAG TPA: class I SAM-dependent methyltransferase [Pyrinomonadaceae bacterium]